MTALYIRSLFNFEDSFLQKYSTFFANGLGMGFPYSFRPILPLMTKQRTSTFHRVFKLIKHQVLV